MVGKAHGWGTFPKWGVGLGYCFIRDPLFREFPCPKALLYTPNLEWGNSEKNKINFKTLSKFMTLRTFQILGTLQKCKVPFLIKLGSTN
jgi:hypothetical protein